MKRNHERFRKQEKSIIVKTLFKFSGNKRKKYHWNPKINRNDSNTTPNRSPYSIQGYKLRHSKRIKCKHFQVLVGRDAKSQKTHY